MSELCPDCGRRLGILSPDECHGPSPSCNEYMVPRLRSEVATLRKIVGMALDVRNRHRGEIENWDDFDAELEATAATPQAPKR